MENRDEEIIRIESREFYEDYIESSDNRIPIDDFRIIKARLSDFYTPESKAIFLDEIQIKVSLSQEEHKKTCNRDNCQTELFNEKLLFYINQELSTFPHIAHTKKGVINELKRDNVFVSYSHSDIGFLDEIKRHFKPFSDKIKFWDDSKIAPGQKWKEEIENAIKNTKVAILLVSADFLASEFIATKEIPPLLKAAEEEGAVILTVILKPCLFDLFPNLNQFQAMNSPSQAVSEMNDNERERLYTNLVRQTVKVLNMN